MPVKNYFPIFHKLKSGAYSYFWTDKCEQLLPKHYKKRCLDYMLKEPEAVHWIPKTEKYVIDKHGLRYPVQNHPIHVRYPDQCNRGLWAGEGIVFCSVKYIKKLPRDKYVQRQPKMYVPNVTERILYSEILSQWISIPCTHRAMDLIDEAFGLDSYILKTHERYLNSKFAMVLRGKMLMALAEGEVKPEIAEKFKDHMIPVEEAEWIGLSTEEALELAESRQKQQVLPPSTVKKMAHEKILRMFAAEREARRLEMVQEEETKTLGKKETSMGQKFKNLLK